MRRVPRGDVQAGDGGCRVYPLRRGLVLDGCGCGGFERVRGVPRFHAVGRRVQSAHGLLVPRWVHSPEF